MDFEKIQKLRAQWEQEALAKHRSKAPDRPGPFTTVSDAPVEMLATPEHLKDFDYTKDLGFPGEYPYTRGVQPNMYRGRLWAMRQFAGFGTAKESNKRYQLLLEQGQTGLSVAFHMPTIMGYDSDHPRSKGEVGKVGVSIDTVHDMMALFDKIPLDKVTTSMTINAPACVLLSMYLVAAERQNVSWDKVAGTTQNDILKEYIAQKSWIYPPRPSLRLITDTMEFCAKNVPRWNTISISGYHIREAGSTAVQELAFTLMDGMTYVEEGIKAGMSPDEFAPRLSFFFNAHNDLFEEVAKYRAARRMWAKVMRDRFKAKKPESWKLRFHTQTAGCSLTAQQPYNNIVRTTIQALAGVLGGTQSLHTNSLDETLSLPTEEAVTIALRTQQIIAEESGVTNTIDPLAGSYFVESLTNQMEKQAWDYIEKIESMGGMVAAIETGYPQAEIANASFRYQQQIDRKEKVVVGVNRYVMEEKTRIPILYIDDKVEQVQIENLKKIKAARDNGAVRDRLAGLKKAASGTDNVMPHVINAVRVDASLGEICDVFREVFGTYSDPGYF